MKTFYSAEDIEALAGQGVTELRVDEDTVVTHLARDMAQRLGVSLVYGTAPSPGIRPGSSQAASRALGPSPGRRSVPAVGLKPRGCQHGPLPNGSSGAARPAGGSDKTVTELIGLVRDLAGRDKDG